MLGDTETTAANQRWADTSLDYAINDQLREMYADAGMLDSNYELSADFAYTASAESTALPLAQQFVPIVRIADVTNASRPIELTRTAAHAGERNRSALAPTTWQRIDGAIQLRPVPTSARTLRISYIGNPFQVTAATGDQHAYPVAHEELICLGACIRLQEVETARKI
jgi:hypothetical protein